MIEAEPVIFVVDDDPSVRKSLLRLLRSFGYEARAFHSAEDFLEQEPYTGAGCIILDIRMPGIGGMALQEELSKMQDSLPIVFITGHGDIPMSVQAIKKRAMDFLPKPFEDEQLIDAVVRAVEVSRQARMIQSELNSVRMRFDRLTPREHEVLPYIIAGLLNKQIAFKLNIAEKTVKVHRAHIMVKLGINSVAELVRLAEKAHIEPSG